MSLPRKSFARRIIHMRGYSPDQRITEVVFADNVPRDEAKRRIDEAIAQSVRRSVGQERRHSEIRYDIDRCRLKILSIASQPDGFLCAEHLEVIAILANWPAPNNKLCHSAWDTGRVFSELCQPMEKEGLLVHLMDPETESLLGFSITPTGEAYLIADYY